MHGQNPPPLSPLGPQIPEDIVVEEILPRLPVKSVLRFRCVSKSWLKQIESDRFVEIQLKISAQNPSLTHHRAVLDPNRFKTGLVDCTLQLLLSSNSNLNPNSKKGFSHPTPKPHACELVGCCNGIVCVYSHPGRFFFWNPATRSYEELPQTERTTGKFGFGRDERSGAYKVFASHREACNLYDSNKNSWRTLPHGARCLQCGIGLFLRGKVHWATYFKPVSTDYVESFDLGSGEYGRIELPFDTKRAGRTSLGEIGGCLSVLVRYKESKLLHLWVMKESTNGVKGSWFKLLALSFDVSPYRNYAMTPLFGAKSNGDVFLIYGDSFFIYSPEDDVLSMAKNVVCLCEARVYVGSLVSPRRILGRR